MDLGWQRNAFLHFQPKHDHHVGGFASASLAWLAQRSPLCNYDYHFSFECVYDAVVKKNRALQRKLSTCSTSNIALTGIKQGTWWLFPPS